MLPAEGGHLQAFRLTTFHPQALSCGRGCCEKRPADHGCVAQPQGVDFASQRFEGRAVLFCQVQLGEYTYLSSAFKFSSAFLEKGRT